MIKKRLLVFGGTFDPVHFGHISILQNAIMRVKPDKTLVIPSYLPPHKTDYGTPAQCRCDMCRVFCGLDKTVEIDTIELDRKGTSYTIETILQLKKQYPDYRIYLVVGSDMLLYFEKWKSYEQLLKLVTIVCQNREASDKKQVLEYCTVLRKKGAKILFCNKDILEISSTEIRDLVKQDKPIDMLVPCEVQKIIKQNSLYKGK